MHTAWGPWSFEPRFATIDGEPLPVSKLHIDGVDADTLPFLGDPPAANVAPLPWASHIVTHLDF